MDPSLEVDQAIRGPFPLLPPELAPQHRLTSNVHQSRHIMTIEGMATLMYTPHSDRHSLDHPNQVFFPGS